MPDLKLFAALITEAGLMDKPFSSMSWEEVQSVIAAAYSAGARSTIPTRFTPPRIENGRLLIPVDADPKYYHWRPCGQSVFETLRELGASDEVFQKYMDADDVPF
jgi:hypothetical protein